MWQKSEAQIDYGIYRVTQSKSGKTRAFLLQTLYSFIIPQLDIIKNPTSV